MLREALFLQMLLQTPWVRLAERFLLERSIKITDNHKKIIITANRMHTGIIDGIPCIHIIDFLLEKEE